MIGEFVWKYFWWFHNLTGWASEPDFLHRCDKIDQSQLMAAVTMDQVEEQADMRKTGLTEE